jgi:hypothetical protein
MSEMVSHQHHVTGVRLVEARTRRSERDMSPTRISCPKDGLDDASALRNIRQEGIHASIKPRHGYLAGFIAFLFVSCEDAMLSSNGRPRAGWAVGGGWWEKQTQMMYTYGVYVL